MHEVEQLLALVLQQKDLIMKTLLCITSLLTVVLTADAQNEAMLNYTGTSPGNGSPVFSTIFADINGPIGWTFQPTTEIDVTALGAFTYLGNQNIEIGLWNSSGTLLASQTITSASTVIDQSRYQSIAPVDLTADQTYYLAAFSLSGPLGAIVVTPDTAPNGFAMMSPDIQLGQVAYSSNSGFTFPSTIDGSTGDAIIAPNFEFQPVPEPSTILLSGVSFASLLLLRQRNKQL
jgi:hypothetical protein